MSRFISLSKITADRERSRDFYEDTEEPGEGAPTVTKITTPILVNVDAIRCCYPRRDNRPGTRLTFTDGGGFAVSELYTDVVTLITPAAAAKFDDEGKFPDAREGSTGSAD